MKKAVKGDWFDMADEADLRKVVFESKIIPNKNEPGGEKKGKLTLTHWATNVEATQDEHGERLKVLEKKLDELLKLAKAA
jgi:hypothetical protein